MALTNIRVCFLLSSLCCVISSLGRNVSLSVVFGLLLNISTGMAQIQLYRKTTKRPSSPKSSPAQCLLLMLICFSLLCCALNQYNDVHVHSNMPTLQLFNLVKITFLLIHVLYNYIILISIDSAKFSVHWQITCVQHFFATFEHMYRGKWDSDAWNNQIFFLLCLQRSALSVAANCCHSIGVGDFHLVADSIPILSGRLQHQVTQKTHRAANNSWSLENFWLACKESSVR